LPIAGDNGRGLIEVDVGDAEAAQFGRTDAGRVKHFNHGPVAEAGRVRRVDLRGEFFDLAVRQDAGRE
jgi:hypothetical protein